MAENETDSVAPEAGADEASAPQVAMIAQYVRDLSFENPNAPASFQNQDGAAPSVDVNVNLGARKAGDDVYEVELSLTVTSKTEEQVAFVVELKYASLFGIRNIPEDQMSPILLIQAPTMMFPFARRIVADAVRDGGFAPLMLDPISFEALYRQQAEQQAAASESEVDNDTIVN